MNEMSNNPSEAVVADALPSTSATDSPSPSTEPSPVVSGESSDSAPSVTLSDVSSSGAAAAGAPSADVGITDESALSWNGELDALTSADWFNTGVNETHRNVLLDGMKTKYKNLEGGFTKKSQALAEERRSFEVREQQLSGELERYKRWLDTGEDIGAQAFREADDLKRQLTAAAGERETAEAALKAQLEAEFTERLSPFEKEREQLQAQLAESRATAESQEQARNEEVLDGLIKWVDGAAPGLWEDENELALATFTNILESGAAADPQTALKMTGALYPQFNPTAPDEIPAALDVMNNESTTSFDADPTGKKVESYADLKSRLESQLFASRRG